MSDDDTDLRQPEPDTADTPEAAAHEVPADLVELYEVLEYQRLVALGANT